MKKNVLITAMLFAAGSLLAADPKDTVLAAAKKLTDAGNYSWKQTVDNGGGGGGGGGGFAMGPTSGKVDKGIAYQSISINDNAIETVTKGTNGARKGGFGGFGGGGGGGGDQPATWQTFEEAAAAAAANGGGGGGGGFGGGRRGGRGGAQQIVPAADQIAALVGDVQDLKESGGAITGDLKPDAATTRATRRGGRGFGGGGGGGGGGFGGGPGGGGPGGPGGGGAPAVTNAKGTVSFWVKDGALSKYELKVSAKGTDFNGDPQDINTTTTVEFSDVGTTKLPVPADIIAKISK
jgi:hypothetical protein